MSREDDSGEKLFWRILFSCCFLDSKQTGLKTLCKPLGKLTKQFVACYSCSAFAFILQIEYLPNVVTQLF